jgi:energy-coupling factor transport system ATP-binding protein
LSAGPPAIEFDDVRFAYVKDTPVLKGIDLTIDRGEFVTIIGQNGSGKSTTVKHLNGLLEPDSGAVRVYDEEGTAYDTREHPMRTLAGLVGYVFQNPDDQIFHTSVYEEIAYGLSNIGVPEAEHAERIETVLEAVNLGGRANGNPFNMGRGERQRLAIASILAMRPGVICVDEPTTGQDRQEAASIMEILQSYNDDGHTVITITHDIALAAQYTDRVVVLSDGRVIADGSPAEVFRDEAHLKQTNVRPPQITQLYGALADRGSPPGDDLWLTVEDAYRAVAQLRDTKGLRPPSESED